MGVRDHLVIDTARSHDADKLYLCARPRQNVNAN
jgi:hypothetical protein